jgi:NAD(P)H-hydrate repair Nnr-like enzyme with NAD(P)H-hydrate dehydratase domain
MIMACVAGSITARQASNKAFMKKRIALVTPDIIEVLGDVMAEYCS